MEKKEKETSEQFENRKQTVLQVSENPISANGRIYATIKDTVIKDNIIPFACHCKIAADRESERERIRKDPNCSKHGVCRHLMRLNTEWENYPLSDSDSDGKNAYMNVGEINRRSVPDIYLQAARHGGLKEAGFVSEKAGITMTSILFCKHGGIIWPVDSGQIDLSYGVFAIPCATEGGPKGDLTDEQKKANARYIYNFFKQQGWTTEAICGMLGNIESESGMNPGIWQYWKNDTKGYGLVQWSDAIDYLNYAHVSIDEVNRMAQNNPQGLMDKQLEFLMKSFTSQDGVGCRWLPSKAEYYLNKLPPPDNVPHDMKIKEYSHSTYVSKDLALVFHATYERSGDGPKQLQERVNYAEDWYLYFTKNRRE